MPSTDTSKNKPTSIFRQVPKWQDLWFYQKSEVLYQLTFAFCERFLPQYGDRTVDQMVQAEAAKWKAMYEDLKQRALKAYQEQQGELERLKKLQIF